MASNPANPRETAEWNRVKQRVLRRDQWRCQACRMTAADWRGIDLHVHHIVAVKDGGTNDPDNLVVVCGHCHATIHKGGPVDGEYPPDIVDGRPSVIVNSRGDYTPGEKECELLQVLQENGPTRRKELLDRTAVSGGAFYKHMENLRWAKLAGKARRGVYAYIARSEYDRVDAELESGVDPSDIRVRLYDPSEDGPLPPEERVRGYLGDGGGQ